MKKLILITQLLIVTMFSQSQNCILCNKTDLINIDAKYHKSAEFGALYTKENDFCFWMYSYDSTDNLVYAQTISFFTKDYAIAFASLLNENKVVKSATKWIDYIDGLPIYIKMKYDEGGYYFIYTLVE